jgi:hypothetical protein
MDEISNKTLATLLVVAIVISLAGTFFAMRGVSQVTNIVTGQLSAATGTAKVNITETISITLLNNTVNFGSGYRNASYASVAECNLSTNTSQPDCWINNTDYNPIPFLLENDGNVYINVTINSSNADNFINGTIIGGGTRRYGWRGGDPLDSLRTGCGGEAGTDLTKDFTDFSASPQLICKNLSATNTEDRFKVDINISVPAGPTGEKTADVIFQAARNY